MKKKVERPWEQPASNKQSVKMEIETKHNHSHSHNCSDHHHNHSPKSSKTEKKENGKTLSNISPHPPGGFHPNLILKINFVFR